MVHHQFCVDLNCVFFGMHLYYCRASVMDYRVPLLVFATIFGFIYTFPFIYLQNDCNLKGFTDHPETATATSKSSSRDEQRPGYLVDTVGCKLTHMDAFDSSVQQFFKSRPSKPCAKPFIKAYGMTLVYDTRHPWYKHTTCCVKSIHRRSQSSSNYNMKADKLVRISNDCMEIPKKEGLKFPSEFVQVVCKPVLNNRTLRHAINYLGTPFPPPLQSNTTAAKVKHWDSKDLLSKQTPPPLNVLMIGIDSVSRLQSIRSMPHTRDFLINNDFIEMRGYTKIGENTFPNAMGFLGGMEPKKYPCWAGAKYKLDDCPFIWRNFSRNHYLTGLVEDEPRISNFNYRRVGFVEQPTDYYLRPLAVAWDTRHCVGGMTQTDLMIKYIKDFTKAVGSYPFFLMSWFTSCSHDDMSLLQSMDDRFKAFLNITVHSKNGDNTVIIFFSDHGYRFGKFRETFLGYYEEALPMFFIRLPPSLKVARPDWYENLRVNSQRLTSPLDLHATLEDILSLTVDHSKEANFSFTHSNWDHSLNRSVYSFFEETPVTRTCESAKIPPEYCRCGVSATVGKNSKSSLKFGHFVIKVINDLIKEEIDENLCVTLKFHKFLYVREIGNGEEQDNLGKSRPFKDHLVAFEASPSKARFEAKVRLFPNNNNTLSVVGDISRINSYKGQNDCLRDSKVRSYCLCTDVYVTKKKKAKGKVTEKIKTKQ